MTTFGSPPADWVRKPLKYLARHIGSGKTPTGGAEVYLDSGVLFIRSQNVHDSGIRLEDPAFISGEVDEEMAGSRTFGMDVLLNITGASIGRCCVMPDGLGPANVNQHVCIIRVAQPQVAWWVRDALQSRFGQSQIEIAQTGAGREGLNFEQIGNIEVLIPPPLAMQCLLGLVSRETAHIDALIEKKTRFIELLREKRQALITQAVTRGLNPSARMRESGVEWLGAVPAAWGVVQLRHVAKLGSGHTPSRERPDWWQDCYIPWFTLADVWQVRRERRKFVHETEERISDLGIANSSAVLHPAGSVMLSRTASVGFPAIMGRDMATSQDFAVWTCGPRLFNEYLYCVLLGMEREFARVRMGSTHKTIYMPDIEAFRIPLPPIDEQHAIVRFLDDRLGRFDELVAATDRSIELLKERRAALITAAVTGQINVHAEGREEQSEPA